FIPLSQPYLVLFLEPLHGVTIAFAMTSSVAFADECVPRGYESSGQGFMSMIIGLGQFTGLCIGGVLGGRNLYRVLAAVVTLGSLPLGISRYWLWMKSSRRKINIIEGEERPGTYYAQQQDQDLTTIEMNSL
ncbi:MAG: MFS transporter, partial [Betaproteobacteria bacterium]